MNTVPTPLQLLVKARELIAKPENWTQECLSRDQTGETCSPEEPVATCWCSLGALTHVVRTLPQPKSDTNYRLRASDNYGLAHQLLADACPGGSVVKWNDSHTHPEVLDLWDQVIERTKQQEAPK